MLQQKLQIVRRERHNVILEILHIRKAEFVLTFCRGAEHFGDAKESFRRRPLESNSVAVILRNHFVIGSGDKTGCWIVCVGQLGVRNNTAPFESASLRNGEKAGPVFAERGETSRVLADV